MDSPSVYEDWTGNVVNDADIRSLDIGAVRAARAMFRERFPGRAEEGQAWDDQTFLSRVGMLKRGKVTVASLLLLGKKDSGLIPDTVCIRWRLLDADGSEQDSRIFRGPLLLISTQAVSMISNWTCEAGFGDDRKKVSAYRNSSLLEAVRNAICHQDYSMGGAIDIVERDRESVTVISKGSFPQRSPESFITDAPPSSATGNKFLIAAMAGIGAVPASGTGIKSMYMAQASRRFPMPDFDISDDRVAVRFPGIRGGAYARVLDTRGDLDLRTIMDLDRLAKLRYVPERRIRALVRRNLVEIMDGVPCIASGAGQDLLSSFVIGTDEDAVIALMERNGSVTRSDVAGILAARDTKELTEEQVLVKATNLLQSMRRKGLVEKAEGSTRSARYVRPTRSNERSELIVKQPFDHIPMDEAVGGISDYLVQGEYDLGIVVVDRFQRAHLPVENIVVQHRQADLVVYDLSLLMRDEINLAIPERTDADAISSAEKLYEHHGFQRSRQIGRSAVQDGFGQTRVHRVVFLMGAQQLLADNIVSIHLVEQESLGHRMYVAVHSFLRHPGNPRDVVHIGHVTSVIHQESGHAVQSRGVSYAGPSRHILEDDRAVYPLEDHAVMHAALIRIRQRYPSDTQILLEPGPQAELGCGRVRFEELGEREREYRYLHVPSREVGGQF